MRRLLLNVIFSKVTRQALRLLLTKIEVVVLAGVSAHWWLPLRVLIEV
jgi:hypothetical protein